MTRLYALIHNKFSAFVNIDTVVRALQWSAAQLSSTIAEFDQIIFCQVENKAKAVLESKSRLFSIIIIWNANFCGQREIAISSLKIN